MDIYLGFIDQEENEEHKELIPTKSPQKISYQLFAQILKSCIS